jgi:gas vesicle protein
MEQDHFDKIVWFMAGTAIGAAVALLFAPQSGEETRRYLGETARQGRKAIGEAGDSVLERGRDLYERGRKIADDAAQLFERGRRIVSGESNA